MYENRPLYTLVLPVLCTSIKLPRDANNKKVEEFYGKSRASTRFFDALDNRKINIACRAETCISARVNPHPDYPGYCSENICPWRTHRNLLVSFVYCVVSRIVVGGGSVVSKQLLWLGAAVGSGLEFQKRVFDVKVNGRKDLPVDEEKSRPIRVTKVFGLNCSWIYFYCCNEI